MDPSSTSREERRAVGRERRKHLARSAHDKWNAARHSRSAWDVLQAAAIDRMPHLLPIKSKRMSASPFGYFRGAAPIMAHDIGPMRNTGLLCRLCGDAHVRNLGAFAAPDGRMVFDLNDFDESLVGPFEWDVKRMAASIQLAAREARHKESDCCDAVHAFLHRYTRSIASFAAMPILEIARYQIRRESQVRTMRSVFAKAERSTPLHLRDSLTEQAPGRTRAPAKSRKSAKIQESGPRHFHNNPPDLERLDQTEAERAIAALVPYLDTLQPERRHLLSRYRPVDVALKVAGTGSVGLRNYVLYLEGNGPSDPLFLQIKQQLPSAWQPYATRPTKQNGTKSAKRPHEGRRVVDGTRAMQVQSDPFLGWTSIDKRGYLVRQLNDHKASLDLTEVTAPVLKNYADLCGELLARGHARSGDPNEIDGYLGTGTAFAKAVAAFAIAYADQTEHDWQELRRRI